MAYGERFSGAQWLGVGLLVAGIFELAVDNLAHWQVGHEELRLAGVTGGFMAP